MSKHHLRHQSALMSRLGKECLDVESRSIMLQPLPDPRLRDIYAADQQLPDLKTSAAPDHRFPKPDYENRVRIQAVRTDSALTGDTICSPRFLRRTRELASIDDATLPTPNSAVKSLNNKNAVTTLNQVAAPSPNSVALYQKKDKPTPSPFDLHRRIGTTAAILCIVLGSIVTASAWAKLLELSDLRLSNGDSGSRKSNRPARKRPIAAISNPETSTNSDHAAKEITSKPQDTPFSRDSMSPQQRTTIKTPVSWEDSDPINRLLQTLDYDDVLKSTPPQHISENVLSRELAQLLESGFRHRANWISPIVFVRSPVDGDSFVKLPPLEPKTVISINAAVTTIKDHKHMSVLATFTAPEEVSYDASIAPKDAVSTAVTTPAQAQKKVAPTTSEPDDEPKAAKRKKAPSITIPDTPAPKLKLKPRLVRNSPAQPSPTVNEPELAARTWLSPMPDWGNSTLFDK
jgi:hypothetical protein